MSAAPGPASQPSSGAAHAIALPPHDVDVAVVGAGQAGLAVGFYLRRTGLSYALLDGQAGPGGAWRRVWPSLRLFSPAQWSSLPGWLMPGGVDAYAHREDVLAYLSEYERRYDLPVVRPVRVTEVWREGECLVAASAQGQWRARAVVSATGTWSRPYRPETPGAAEFEGRQLHSAQYAGPDPFEGQRVVVVGGGNSGAQIAAELSRVAVVTWATRRPPVFLPEHVDGRYLFEQATARYRALREGREPDPPRSLGDVVQVPEVREARARGALAPVPVFTRLWRGGVEWPDRRRTREDVVLWCTGFRPALDHLLRSGAMDQRGRVEVRGTRALRESRLWLVGYGEWTGYASATLVGVGRSARATVEEIAAELRGATASPRAGG